MVQKYIVDKADIHNLLTGKEIPLERRSKARAFCVEIASEITNGEVIRALFPNASVEYWAEYSTYIINFPNDNDAKHFSFSWWNAPYKKGGE